MKVVVLQDDNLLAVAEESGRSIEEITKLHTDAFNRNEVALFVIDQVNVNMDALAVLTGRQVHDLLLSDETDMEKLKRELKKRQDEYLRFHWGTVDMANGRSVPKRCVDALNEYELVWPGATFPTARAAIVAAVLDAYWAEL